MFSVVMRVWQVFHSAAVVFWFSSVLLHRFFCGLETGMERQWRVLENHFDKSVWALTLVLLPALLFGVQVSGSDVGTAIGFAHATRSLCGIVSPTVGGYINATYGIAAVGLVPGALSFAALLFLWTIGPAASKQKNP